MTDVIQIVSFSLTAGEETRKSETSILGEAAGKGERDIYFYS